MTKKQWKSKITKACKEAGTYQPFFEEIINTLASIMEMRDNAQTMFEESGGKPVYAHTNKGGATNIVKNPTLVAVMDCNAQALAYWRDLGLTPAGLKKLNAEVVKDKQSGSLEKLLEKIV